MKLKAVIEIPRGSNRRIHLAYDKSGFVDLGPIAEAIPVNNGVMPVAYGYLENTFNHQEKDNEDVLVFSTRNFKTGEAVSVEAFGLLRRADLDHKVLAHDDTVDFQSWSAVPVELQKLIIEYFGFKHPIEAIEDAAFAQEYIQRSWQEG